MPIKGQLGCNNSTASFWRSFFLVWRISGTPRRRHCKCLVDVQLVLQRCLDTKCCHFITLPWLDGLMINGLLLGIYMNIKIITNSCVLLSFELWTGARRGSTIPTMFLFTTDSWCRSVLPTTSPSAYGCEHILINVFSMATVEDLDMSETYEAVVTIIGHICGEIPSSFLIGF